MLEENKKQRNAIADRMQESVSTLNLLESLINRPNYKLGVQGARQRISDENCLQFFNLLVHRQVPDLIDIAIETKKQTGSIWRQERQVNDDISCFRLHSSKSK